MGDDLRGREFNSSNAAHTKGTMNFDKNYGERQAELRANQNPHTPCMQA